jgi:hypothetical protein
MTQKFITVSDVFWRWLTPILFAILAWNANRIVDKIDKIDEWVNTIRIAQERHETRIISVDEMLRAHIQGERR